MHKLLPIIVALLDITILLFSALLLLTVAGMSVMIFDAGESVKLWIVFGIIAVVCLGLAIAALYYAIHFFRKKRYLLSILGSAIPLIAFFVLQVIASVL